MGIHGVQIAKQRIKSEQLLVSWQFYCCARGLNIEEGSTPGTEPTCGFGQTSTRTQGEP